MSLSSSLNTYLESGGRTYTSPRTYALQGKIKLGESKSGPCKQCLANQRTGIKTPPLHENCKCSTK